MRAEVGLPFPGRFPDPPRLLLITDCSTRTPRSVALRAAEWARRLPPRQLLVQLRDPELSAVARLELARTLRRTTRAHGQLLFVNDRLDLALLAEADGLHLKEGSVAGRRVREAHPDLLLTRACHDPGRLPIDCDAVVLSPVAAPRKGRAAWGFEVLRQAASQEKRPLYALGGVDAAAAAQAFSAGAAGVAVIGAALGPGAEPPAWDDAAEALLGVLLRGAELAGSAPATVRAS